MFLSPQPVSSSVLARLWETVTGPCRRHRAHQVLHDDVEAQRAAVASAPSGPARPTTPTLIDQMADSDHLRGILTPKMCGKDVIEAQDFDENYYDPETIETIRFRDPIISSVGPVHERVYSCTINDNERYADSRPPLVFWAKMLPGTPQQNWHEYQAQLAAYYCRHAYYPLHIDNHILMYQKFYATIPGETDGSAWLTEFEVSHADGSKEQIQNLFISAARTITAITPPDAPKHDTYNRGGRGFVEQSTIGEIGVIYGQLMRYDLSFLGDLAKQAYEKAGYLSDIIMRTHRNEYFAHGNIRPGTVLVLPKAGKVDEHIIFTDWQHAGMRPQFFDVACYAVFFSLTSDQWVDLLTKYLGDRSPREATIIYFQQLMCLVRIREAFWSLKRVLQGGYKLAEYKEYLEHSFDAYTVMASNDKIPNALPLCLAAAQQQLLGSLEPTPGLDEDVVRFRRADISEAKGM